MDKQTGTVLFTFMHRDHCLRTEEEPSRGMKTEGGSNATLPHSHHSTKQNEPHGFFWLDGTKSTESSDQTPFACTGARPSGPRVLM